MIDDIGGAALIPLPWVEQGIRSAGIPQGSVSQLKPGVPGAVFGGRMLILEQMLGNQWFCSHGAAPAFLLCALTIPAGISVEFLSVERNFFLWVLCGINALIASYDFTQFEAQLIVILP